MCRFCRDLNDEKEHINVDEIEIQGRYYHYSMPIIHCPVCGKILDKYKGKSNEELKALIEYMF